MTTMHQPKPSTNATDVFSKAALPVIHKEQRLIAASLTDPSTPRIRHNRNERHSYNDKVTTSRKYGNVSGLAERNTFPK